MTFDDLLEYYADSLISQYRGKTRARATVKAFGGELLGDNILMDIRDAFDIDTAFGIQLDIVGKYIGVPRRIKPLALPKWFSMGGYEEGEVSIYGFTGYDDSGSSEGIFAGYNDSGQGLTDLSDEEYRQVLLIKAYTNVMDGTLKGIADFLWDFFPSQIQVIDNMDMTLTFLVDTNFTTEDAILLTYLPRPMGVGINIVRTDLSYPKYRITEEADERITEEGVTREMD